MSVDGKEMALNARALEVAVEANTNALRAIEVAERGQAANAASLSDISDLKKWATDHETHDAERFKTITDKLEGTAKDIQSGFRGVYGRLWWFAGGIGAAMLAVILTLVNMLGKG